ncbi:MAG: 2Fe-2S iron-sulfur cluster binding domain-containing protein [Chloroflexia bacterium]|nr:2Fe-2S iron-sulfur cluster binding domain-containing protein [Chloroflexia bacterium]
MTEFLLNNKLIRTDLPKGMILLDFIRNERGLKGTKTACREGDCGSCTILLGTLNSKGDIHYKAITSCITPLGNAHGKHVVTIEGLNSKEISPVQKSLVDTAAIQCGYCTPGIVLSLTGYVLSEANYSFERAKDAVGGNICRCTGYKSIERAIEELNNVLKSSKMDDGMDALVANNFVPAYFKDIKSQLQKIKSSGSSENASQVIGGGTDLYVQRPDEMIEVEPRLVSNDPSLTSITLQGGKLKIGAACKMTELLENKTLQDTIPGFKNFIELIASKLIRNIATVAGNIVNASPIGDLSILFLALDAMLEIETFDKKRREVKLKDFFKAYKKIDLQKNEMIKSITIELPDGRSKFNFEKVSKRKYLDIASVNSAILVEHDDHKITDIHMAVGGVAPIPKYLSETCKFLKGKELSDKTIAEAAELLGEEISPISDVRGSAEYKKLLAKQLFYAHFLELFPEYLMNLEIRT